MRANLVNVALYEAGWVAAITLAARGNFAWAAMVPLALTAVHLALVRDPARELAVVAVAGLLGCAVDTALIALAAFAPHGSGVLPALPPLWLVALWVQLATLLRFALRWLAGKYLLAALLGAVGGPLAFLVGVRMGAATLPLGPVHAITLLAPAWALVIPLLVALARVIGSPGSRGEYRLAP